MTEGVNAGLALSRAINLAGASLSRGFYSACFYRQSPPFTDNTLTAIMSPALACWTMLTVHSCDLCFR